MRLERIAQIRDWVAAREVASIDDICAEFGISKSTLRRDLDTLEKEGSIKKVYGGVRINQTRQPVPYESRGLAHLDAKIAVGRAAAALVEENDVLFLDSGTTTPHILDHIGDMHVTVITYSLGVLAKAADMPNVGLYALPGPYFPGTNSFCGAETAMALQQYHLTKAFMAASGFTVEHGATHSTLFEQDAKRAAIQKAQDSYLLVDSSKFGTTTMMTFAQPEEFQAVITDGQPSKEFAKKLERLSLPVICAGGL